MLKNGVDKRPWLRILFQNLSGSSKRALDIAVVACLLLAVLPFLPLIAWLIKLQDGGPVLYWQCRVGKNGRLFRLPKFRSMVINAESALEEILHQNHHASVM